MDQIARSRQSAQMLDTARLESGPLCGQGLVLHLPAHRRGWVRAGGRRGLLRRPSVFVGCAPCSYVGRTGCGLRPRRRSKTPTCGRPPRPFTRRQYGREYGHFREMAMLFYSSNRTAESYFWEARRLLGGEDEVLTPTRLHPGRGGAACDRLRARRPRPRPGPGEVHRGRPRGRIGPGGTTPAAGGPAYPRRGETEPVFITPFRGSQKASAWRGSP